jgi:hypothetical protein
MQTVRSPWKRGQIKVWEARFAARRLGGAAFGSDKANEDVAPVQAKVVEALASAILEKIA